MKLPKNFSLRTAIILFILAVILTISGASILFEKFSEGGVSGMASASVGITIGTKPAAPPPLVGPPSPGSVAGAGAGGAGGGGGGGSLKPRIISWEKFFPVFSEGARTISVPAEVETTVYFVSVEMEEDAINVTFKTRDYYRKPSIVEDAPGIVYRYCMIGLESLDTSLAGEKLAHFRVEKNWFETKKIGIDTIILYRWDGEKWATLSTKKTGSSEEFYFYKAEAQDFSVFAVSGSEIKTDLHLVHDENITLQRGEKATYTMVVENIGDSWLENVVLNVQDSNFEISVSPEVIEELPVGSRGTYILTITAPADIEPGIYPITVRAETAEAFKESKLLVIVSSTPKPAIGALLSEQIDNLKSTANKLWLEAQWIGLRGGNVSAVFDFINNAKEKLTKAAATFGMVSFDETSDYVESARSDLEGAVVKMAEQQPFLSIFRLSPKLIAIIVGLVLIVIAVGYVSMSKYERVIRVQKRIEKGVAKKEYYKDEKKRAKLTKQLALIEEGYRKGYIKEKAYKEAKAKINRALGKKK